MSGRSVSTWMAVAALLVPPALPCWPAFAQAADPDKPAAQPAADADGSTPADAATPGGTAKPGAKPGAKPAAKPAAKHPTKPDAAKQAAAKEEAAEFKAARPEIQRQMKSKTVSTRVEGVRRLAGYPQVEAAKLAITAGMVDEAPEVRTAAYETLLKFSTNEEICRYFLDQLNRQARRNDLSEKSVPMLAALLASPVQDIDLSTRELLDSLDKSRKGELLVTELADQLGTRDAEDSIPLLVKLSKTQLFTDHFGVRRAIVDALVRIDRIEAIGELIRFLTDVQGEARADILKYLASVTGEHFNGDAKAWAMWWRQDHDGFVLPGPAARQVVAFAAADTSYYYGIPIYARKLVFVFDTSSSMAGGRLNAAKRELNDAIRNLHEETQFSLVIFNGDVEPWQRRLVPANKGNKEAAIAFVMAQQARSSTASFDALEAAFLFDAEAIYFLSDGEPTTGKVVAPVDIVNLISLGNRSRRESIYSIGLAPGPPDSAMELFMRALAEQNMGQYRRVDE
ncbi:MAG TPA: VWA domain-containing protein [Pirellulales bacterium]|nr:VWA domain-containing protein [Pirellulales bacterium]